MHTWMTLLVLVGAGYAVLFAMMWVAGEADRPAQARHWARAQEVATIDADPELRAELGRLFIERGEVTDLVALEAAARTGRSVEEAFAATDAALGRLHAAL